VAPCSELEPLRDGILGNVSFGAKRTDGVGHPASSIDPRGMGPGVRRGDEVD
jgi:hypothetical protein